MSDDKHKKDIDEVSGVETTGHEWDGLKELNNPLPRWWVWVFLICCIWSFGYFIVYPSWPTLSGSTKGIGGYTQFKELAKSQAEILERQKAYLDRFEAASDEEVLNDAELYAFARAGGAAAFKDNCATCHGTGATGGFGYPNLQDDDWLWGGHMSDVKQTITYGIRAENLDTRISQMPAFGKDNLLKKDEINAVVDYVLSLSGDEDSSHGDHGVDLALGQKVFKAQCVSCHGEDGKGLDEFGAPNLTDKIWLYGGGRATVYETVYYSRAGMMPAWGERLDENTIRQLAFYLQDLGGVVSDDEDVKQQPEEAQQATDEIEEPVETDIKEE